MRVLAADDDEPLLRALGRRLTSWGYEVDLAPNGVEAWRILKRADDPRLVILDWEMPGLTGIEVCRLLRGTPLGAQHYVLVLTAKQQRDDIIEALEAGADDFLTKPFSPRELQLRLAKGVRDRRVRAGADRAPDAPPSGMILGGKYRLERKVASGGMGSVWLGVHLALGVNVAIKLMHPELIDRADFTSFEREARQAAQLRNEHTVRIYDHGLTAEGVPYLVMEYLAGGSVGGRIRREGALAPSEVVSLVDQAAQALNEAHTHGVVHRDVKPDNLLLHRDPGGGNAFTVKLIDFGLARRYEPGTKPSSMLSGTPEYMSPEYLSGESAPNAKLDLWGLAATAFAAMTGRAPFDGRDLEDVRRKVCDAPLPVPSETGSRVPPGFDAWFARACDRDASRRFGSATELAKALHDACASTPSTALTASTADARNVDTLEEVPADAFPLPVTLDAAPAPT